MGNCQLDGIDQRKNEEKNTVESQEDRKKIQPQTNNFKKNVETNSSTKGNDTNGKQREQSLTPFLDSPYTFIRRPAPNFSGLAYHNNVFKKITLREFKGQYVVLFFFPFDFSEVCRKDILAFSDLNDKFQKAACQIIGCSQDSQIAHKNYCQKKRNEGGLGPLEYPLLSDADKQISTSYGVIIEEGEKTDKGSNFRSTFIIDSNQILRHMSINDIAISVNPEEVLRLVYSFQQSDRENPSQTLKGCPFAQSSKDIGRSLQEIDTFSRYQKNKSDDIKDNKKKPDQMSKLTVSKSKKEEDIQESLFVKLGGDEGVEDIANKFISYIYGDQLLKPFFLNKISATKHKKAVGKFLKIYFGSPELYLGKNMKEIHKEVHLNDEHFNKVTDYFRMIFKDLNIKPQVAQEALILIEPLRSQITSSPPQSLFHRVDGEQGIRKAINIYFSKILQINEIKPFYSKVDTEKIKELYIQYLSLVFGGQSKYKGKQMREAHSSFHIPEKVFNFCISNILNSFKETGVDLNSINEIGRLLECLRSEIPKKSNTLYDRLGGETIMTKVMKTLYEDKLMKEEKLLEFFKNVDMKKLGQKMTSYYTMITGGPNKYEGKSAKDAHKSLCIMSNQFEIYKNYLKQSFLENQVSNENVSELINLLDTIKIDVIGGKPPSLFDKIGGEEVISVFSKKLFELIKDQKNIRHYFINVDTSKVELHFREFIFMSTGGPSRYSGQNVRDLHEQMDISDKDFSYFMEVFKNTVTAVKIKQEFQGELIALFESMRNMIATIED